MLPHLSVHEFRADELVDPELRAEIRSVIFFGGFRIAGIYDKARKDAQHMAVV